MTCRYGLSNRSDDDPVCCNKLVRRHRKVGASRSAQNPSGPVEACCVTRAEPADLFAARDGIIVGQTAAQMRADAHQHKPLRMTRPNSVVICRRRALRQSRVPRKPVDQMLHRTIAGAVDFVLRPVSNDDGQGIPRDRHLLPTAIGGRSTTIGCRELAVRANSGPEKIAPAATNPQVDMKSRLVGGWLSTVFFMVRWPMAR
jgi:hypothetical protein